MPIVLLRHGSTHPLSRENPDPALNREGVARVKETVQRLPAVSHIVVDTTKRTQETAKLWAEKHGASVHVDPRLDNWDLGPDHKGKHSAATDALVSRLIAHPDEVPKGGESMRQYQERLFSALGPLIAGKQLVGVVNHSRGIKSAQTAVQHPDTVTTPEDWAKVGLIPKGGAMLVTPTSAERL